MKKIVLLFMEMLILSTITSCNDKPTSMHSGNYEQYNDNYIVLMGDKTLYYGDDNIISVVDYETFETSILCNIPNCAHTTNDCLISRLNSADQLPVIYNDSAYYFVNLSNTIHKENKLALELKTSVMKYDFNSIEFEKIAEISGANANSYGGGFLIGNEYYFLTYYGNPKYDEFGNLISSSSGGGGNLFAINLDTGDFTDYGEIFDYEELKKEYPSASLSTSIHLIGKMDSKLYIGVNFIKEEITQEMNEIGLVPSWSGFTYTFDLNTQEFNKINDEFSTCISNGYISYLLPKGDKYVIMLQDAKDNTILEGPVVETFKTINIINDKIWYDSKCYDIKTKTEKRITDMNFGTAISVFNNYYIIKSEDSNGRVAFEKIPCEEIDKLFE